MGFASYMLGVTNVHPANSGSEMLLLLLNASIKSYVPFPPTCLVEQKRL